MDQPEFKYLAIRNWANYQATKDGSPSLGCGSRIRVYLCVSSNPSRGYEPITGPGH